MKLKMCRSILRCNGLHKTNQSCMHSRTLIPKEAQIGQPHARVMVHQIHIEFKKTVKTIVPRKKEEKKKKQSHPVTH